MNFYSGLRTESVRDLYVLELARGVGFCLNTDEVELVFSIPLKLFNLHFVLSIKGCNLSVDPPTLKPNLSSHSEGSRELFGCQHRGTPLPKAAKPIWARQLTK